MSSLPEVFCIDMEQFWMEFTGVKNAGVRPVSFVESFPITMWMNIPVIDSVDKTSGAKLGKALLNGAKVDERLSSHTMGILVNIGAKICAQINHYQFCFLMRLVDTLTRLGKTLADEAKLHEDEFTELMLASVKKATG